MKNYLLFVFLLIFISQGELLPQPNTGIDSLQRVLSNAKNLNDSVSTLCRLCWMISDTDPEKTFTYGTKILELSQRVKDVEKLSELYDAAALSFWVNGNLTKAKELYNNSLEIAHRNNLTNRVGWENFHLATIFEQEGNIQETSKYLLESRRAFKLSNDIRRLVSSDKMLIKYNESYIDSSINDCIAAIKLTDNPDEILYIYTSLVNLYRNKENKTQSMLYAMKTLEIAEGLNNKKAIVSACYEIGDYLRDYQHNYEIALSYYQKILEIYEEVKNELGIAGVLEEIGTVHKLLGNVSLAADYYNKSLSIAKRINHRHTIANAYKNIGEIYYSSHNYNEALKYFIKCYDTGCDQCKPIVFHSVLIDIGNAYLNSNDYQNAIKYYKKSMQLADSANSNPERAASYLALADIYKLTNISGKALQYYHHAFDRAAVSNSLSLQKDAAQKLHKIYLDKNDFKNAYKYLSLSNVLTDSLNRISEVENLSRLETKFEFQNLKSQKEAEVNKQTQQKYFFIAAFILTTILGIVIYAGFRRKKKDSSLLQHQKEQIEEMSRQVHEADQKKLNFFTNISHEFRTPLTLILGPIEKLIKDNSEKGSTLPMLNMVRRNSLHLFNLINQLLDIRKLDTGNIKLKVTKDDITCYCKGIFSGFLHLAEDHNISYNFTSYAENISGWFDKDILEKVLNNLLSNAFKYTAENGEISLCLSPVLNQDKATTHVKLVIRDTGKGIPEDQLQYVFDRYYQVENTNTGFNTGTGIGLAYTKELIELHKGEISLESKSGLGSVFTIILPIDTSYYHIEERSSEPESLRKENVDYIRQQYLEEFISSEASVTKIPERKLENHEAKVMLVVEDNSDLRDFIRSIFADEYIIYEAAEGLSGLSMANELIPDIIISDIMMPGMNGLELSGKLKSNIHTNHIPILILTAKSAEDDEIEGLKTGADDYLTKPFNSEILKIRVNRLIESKEKLREYFTKEFLLNPKEVKLVSPEDEFLKKAVKIVEENISNSDLNVEMLADELAVSKIQLFRKLKALTNYSANQFIRNIRLKRAAQLLQQNSINITQVLYESGFNSPSYFTTCFKEMYGCLPKEYATKHKNETFRVDF